MLGHRLKAWNYHLSCSVLTWLEFITLYSLQVKLTKKYWIQIVKYCIGGSDGRTPSDRILELDQEALTWRETGQMSAPRAGHKTSIVNLSDAILNQCINWNVRYIFLIERRKWRMVFFIPFFSPLLSLPIGFKWHPPVPDLHWKQLTQIQQCFAINRRPTSHVVLVSIPN